MPYFPLGLPKQMTSTTSSETSSSPRPRPVRPRSRSRSRAPRKKIRVRSRSRSRAPRKKIRARSRSRSRAPRKKSPARQRRRRRVQPLEPAKRSRSTSSSESTSSTASTSSSASLTSSSSDVVLPPPVRLSRRGRALLMSYIMSGYMNPNPLSMQSLVGNRAVSAIGTDLARMDAARPPLVGGGDTNATMQQIEQSRRQLSALRAQNEASMRAVKQDAERKMSALDGEIKRRQSEIKRLQTENKGLLSQSRRLAVQNAELKGATTVLKRQGSRNNQKIQRLQQQKRRVEEQNAFNKELAKRNQIQMKVLEKNVADLKKAKTGLKRGLIKARKQNNQLKTDFQKTERKLEKKFLEVEKMRRENENNILAYTRAIQSLGREVDKLKEEKRKLSRGRKRERQELKDEILKVNREKEQLQSKHEVEMKKQRSKYSQQVLELNNLQREAQKNIRQKLMEAEREEKQIQREFYGPGEAIPEIPLLTGIMIENARRQNQMSAQDNEWKVVSRRKRENAKQALNDAAARIQQVIRSPTKIQKIIKDGNRFKQRPGFEIESPRKRRRRKKSGNPRVQQTPQPRPQPLPQSRRRSLKTKTTMALTALVAVLLGFGSARLVDTQIVKKHQRFCDAHRCGSPGNFEFKDLTPNVPLPGPIDVSFARPFEFKDLTPNVPLPGPIDLSYLRRPGSPVVRKGDPESFVATQAGLLAAVASMPTQLVTRAAPYVGPYIKRLAMTEGFLQEGLGYLDNSAVQQAMRSMPLSSLKGMLFRIFKKYGSLGSFGN